MKKKDTIYFVAIFFILLFGFLFRLKAYLSCRPVWLDETFLFFNIYKKGFLSFFSILDLCQSAPPLFLGIEKIFVSIFGIKEFSLRLFPFLCSFASLPAFYFFSKSILNKRISIIIANILFSVNLYLIFYSQELKQYSLDVLCFMLLFLFFKNLSIKDFNAKNTIKYIIISVISPFLSLISFFPISAWVVRELIIHRIQFIKKLFITQIPLILLSIYYYFCMLKPQRQNILDVSADFWGQGFLSFNLQNDITLVKNILLYIFQPCNYYILLFILLLIGMGILIRNFKRKEILLLLIISAEILIASFLQVYPIFERASLFLIPVVIVTISMCFDICDFNHLSKKIYSIGIIILFLISVHNYNYKYLTKRIIGKVTSYSNAKLMMQILKEQYNPDDTVIISKPSRTEYLYYKLYYKFKPKKQIYTDNAFPLKGEHEEELNRITKDNEKYWFFYSMDYTNEKLTRTALENWKNEYKVLYENEKLKKKNKSYILYLQR